MALIFSVVNTANACNFFNDNLQPNNVYTIQSLNYPKPYPSIKFTCYYKATAPTNYKIKLYCDVFSILGSANCAYSRFSYSPSGNAQFPDLQYRCGYFQNLAFETTGNKFAARFDNNHPNVVPNPGFHCYLWTVPNTQGTTSVTTVPPPTCQCGAHNLATRIVNGTETKVNEFPFMAALLFQSTGSSYCGASLISSNWVLTASHCVKDYKASDIFVRLGAHDISLTTEAKAYNYFVSQIITHANYNATTVDNDIALLKLQTPVQFTSAISPVCLPFKFPTSDFSGEQAIATGWGMTSFQGSTSNVLMEVVLPVISLNTCTSYPSVAGKLTQNMFCTYLPGNDACQGDSGGPLLWINNNRVYQIGIVSWGIDCAKTGNPGVYTKVNNYLTWIQQNTGENFCTT